MRERPILFSGPMVRAILDGRKTQTRRICKPAYHRMPSSAHPDYVEIAGAVHPAAVTGWIAWFPGQQAGLAEFTKQVYQHGFPCPYGVPGDRLWVRETWSLSGNGPFYRADTMQPETVHYHWHPSIHMPRWASRLTLEVVKVRAERLQDISAHDVLAEGISVTGPNYIDLWDSLNAKRGYPWSSNPWVWVIEFKRLEEPCQA